MNAVVLFLMHGIINFIDTTAKCHHLTILTCKGTCGRCLSEFIDWRYSQFSHVGIFLPALWTLAPLTFSLFQLSPLVPVWISIMCACIQCVRGWGYEVLDSGQINTWRKVSIILDDDISHCLLWVLSFYDLMDVRMWPRWLKTCYLIIRYSNYLYKRSLEILKFFYFALIIKF